MTIDIADTTKLQKTLELRKKELQETTKQAVSAIAVNTLKALRANTTIANPNKNKITIKLSSLKVVPRKNYTGWIILNQLGLTVRVHDTLITLVTPAKKNKPKLYHVTNEISKNKIRKFYVIATSQSEVRKKIKEIVQKNVNRRKGLAKTALGVAMAKIASLSIQNDNVNYQTKILASQLNEVEVKESGLNSGEVSIKIHDKLDYATYALKGGENYVSIAQNNALNKILGLLAHKIKKSGRIEESLAIKNLILQV